MLAIFAAESRFCRDGCHKFDYLTRTQGAAHETPGDLWTGRSLSELQFCPAGSTVDPLLVVD
jgi:hypothetical protein